MARPSSLTPELRERIERELADGIPIVVVAQSVGVGRSTLHGWISSGRVSRSRPKLELVQGRAPENVSPESLAERLAAAEPDLVAVVANARHDWRSAAWLLERIAPERWAKPSRTRALGERPRVPLADDPFVSDRARQDVEQEALGLGLFLPERRQRIAALAGEHREQREHDGAADCDVQGQHRAREPAGHGLPDWAEDLPGEITGGPVPRFEKVEREEPVDEVVIEGDDF